MTNNMQGRVARRFWQNSARGKIGPSELYKVQEQFIKESVLPIFSSGDRVLDIGCADGEFSLLLAQAAESVVGVDISSKLIQQAEEKAKIADVTNVDFRVADAFSLDMDTQFQIVSLMGVLTTISDDVAAAKLLLRTISLLENNGLLVLEDSVLLNDGQAKILANEEYEAKYRPELEYLSLTKSLGLELVMRQPLVTMDNCGQTSVMYVFRLSLPETRTELVSGSKVACYGSMPFHLRSLKPLSEYFEDSLLTLSIDEVIAWKPDVIVVADGWSVEFWRTYCDAHNVLLIGMRHGSVTRYGFPEIQYNCTDYMCGSVWDIDDAINSKLRPRQGFLLTGNAWVDQTFHLPEKAANKERPTILFAPTYNPEISAAVFFGDRIVSLIRQVFPDSKIIIKPHPAIVQHEHAFVVDKDLFRDLMVSWREASDNDSLVELIDDPEASISDSFADADILIADASSLIFEYMVLDRPILLYSSDNRIENWEYNANAPGNAWRDIGLEFKDTQTFLSLLASVFSLHAQTTREAQLKRIKQLYGRHTDGFSVARVADAISKIPRLQIVIDARNSQETRTVVNYLDTIFAFKDIIVIGHHDEIQGVRSYLTVDAWIKDLRFDKKKPSGAVLIIDGKEGFIPGSAHQVTKLAKDICERKITSAVLYKKGTEFADNASDVGAADAEAWVVYRMGSSLEHRYGVPAWILLSDRQLMDDLGTLPDITNTVFDVWWRTIPALDDKSAAWPVDDLNVIPGIGVLPRVGASDFYLCKHAELTIVPPVYGSHKESEVLVAHLYLMAIPNQKYSKLPLSLQVSVNDEVPNTYVITDTTALKLEIPYKLRSENSTHVRVYCDSECAGLKELAGPVSLLAQITKADISTKENIPDETYRDTESLPLLDVAIEIKGNTGLTLPQIAKKIVRERADEFKSSAQRYQFYVRIAEHLVEQSLSKADYPAGKGIPTVVKDELREVSVLLAEELDIGQVEEIAQRLTDNITELLENDTYQLWIHQHSIREVDAEIIAERMTLEWQSHPTLHCFLFLLPGEENLLADTIDSLGTQFYSKWQLTVIAGTPVPDPIFDQVDNLRWRIMLEGETPYEVLNQQISNYGADWTLFIEPGTRFEVNTFAKIADYINLHPEWSFIYTDDDQVDSEGGRTSPRFKPDFNLDLLRSSPYIGVGWMRTQDLLAMGGIGQLPGAENYDLALRWLDNHDETVMGHIADVLVHLPKQGDRPFDSNAGTLALQQHLERNAIQSTVQQGYLDNSYRVEYHHPEQPKVTIIIPTKDKLEFFQPCIESLLEKTSYPNYEVIVVDNQSTDPDTLAYYRVLAENYPDKVQVCFYDKPFNFSAMNNWAAEKASGDYLLLLNNDTEIIQAEWLSRMMAYGQRDDIGIVGARLVYPTTGKVQHVGVVLGLTLIADHPYNGQLGLKDDSHMGRAQLDQNYSAVTAAVLLVKKEVYQEVGGMDAENLAVLFNDVDLCIKVGDAGYKILWTPHAMAVHHGSTSVGAKLKDGIYTDFQALADKEIRTQKEQRFMVVRWLSKISNDPAYNKNLSLCKWDFSVDINFMNNWDVNYHSRLRCFGVPISGGSGFYRLAQPFNMLSERGLAQCEIGRHHVSVTELERLKPDTYVFQNAINDQEIANIRFIGEHHPRLHKVFTIDDLLHDLPEKSSLYRKNKRKFRDAKARIRRALSYCDRLIASTQPLADLCADMIDDIRVIPNRLEGKVWSHLVSKRQQGDKPRVGWAGALQHQGDLEIIFDVVKETASEVDWVFMGMCPDEIRDYVKEFHPPVPIENYPEKLASLNLDLAIAPLEIHPFNESKTNLRLLEYGILGWPVICTDIYPYRSHNAPVIRVRNEKHEWLNAIRAAVSSPEMLRESGEIIRQWVLDHFILEDHLHEWMEALLPVSVQLPKQSSVEGIEEAADVA